MPDPPPYEVPGGGKAEDSTRWVGADCCRMEPVVSLDGAEACGRDCQGLSLVREKSLLQPAAPADISASNARRDTARERDGSSNLDMDNSLIRNNKTSKLNTG